MAIREVTLGGLTREQLLEMHYQMALIRRFEDKAAEEYSLGRIGGFLHLYIGQEASGAGIISALRPEDYVVSSYREHGHAILKGMEPRAVMAELLGKATGCSKGKGGSMHMYSAEHNLIGGQAIVGAQLAIATGLGFAIQYQKEERVAVSLFGDGAVDEGAFHESLNLAALWKLPVVFVCENNQYSMGMAVTKAWSVASLEPRAAAYGMPYTRVDGMDVLSVREAMLEAVERARGTWPDTRRVRHLSLPRPLAGRSCLLPHTRRGGALAHRQGPDYALRGATERGWPHQRRDHRRAYPEGQRSRRGCGEVRRGEP